MTVDVSGSAADLERLRNGLRSAATSDGFESDTEVGERPAKLSVYRSHGTLAVLDTEPRLIVAGDRTSRESSRSMSQMPTLFWA